MTTEATPEIEPVTEITAADIEALIDALPERTDPTFTERLDRILIMASAVDVFARDALIDRIITKTGVKRRALNARIKEVVGRAKQGTAAAIGIDAFERGDHVEVSQRLMIKNLEGAKYGDGKIHMYDPEIGIWASLTAEAIHYMIKQYAGAPVGNAGGMRMDHGDLKGIRLTTEEDFDHLTGEFFREDVPTGFAFRNGFVSIAEDGAITIKPHSPENKARWRYDFDFDPNLPAPNFVKFLMELTRDDPPQDRVAKVQLVLEHAGASLIGQAWRGGLALILHGNGNDGKSTLVGVIRDCFPSGTVTAVPPHDFDQDYKRAMLAGSLLNVCGELADRELKNAEAIKDVITGRDLLQARNPYERPFFFKALAGQLIVANGLPPVSDQSQGFWRRWAVVPFTRSFLASEEVRNISEILEGEREAITVKLIQAAASWVARGHKFVMPKTVEVATTAWRSGADAVSIWFSTGCEIVADNGLTGEDAFVAFNEWRAANMFAPLSSRTFGERIKAVTRAAAKAGRLHPKTTIDRRATIEREGFYRHDNRIVYPVRPKLTMPASPENLDHYLS